MWEKCIEQIIAIYLCVTDTIIQILSLSVQRFLDSAILYYRSCIYNTHVCINVGGTIIVALSNLLRYRANYSPKMECVLLGAHYRVASSPRRPGDEANYRVAYGLLIVLRSRLVGGAGDKPA